MMSPVPPSMPRFSPDWLLTSRLGSQDLACAAIRPTSYWPQPSLKVTHMTIDGLLMCSSIISFISRS